jgi:hypothetical protein
MTVTNFDTQMAKDTVKTLENPRDGVLKSKLAKNPRRAVTGKRGFIPVENPKDRILKIRVTTENKDFIESWCTLWGITQSELLLRSIECYTGFDGKNGNDLINHHEDILPM